MHFEVRTGTQAIVSAGPYGADNPRNQRRALTKLSELARALGGANGDEAVGRRRLAQISKYTFQGMWDTLPKAGVTPASPFRFEGFPLGLYGGSSAQRYTIAQQDDGSSLVTCGIRWRHAQDNPLMLSGDGVDGQIYLTDDSYATGKLVIRVNPDGSAETVEPITVETHFVPRADTTLGRMAQAIGSINLPSL